MITQRHSRTRPPVRSDDSRLQRRRRGARELGGGDGRARPSAPEHARTARPSMRGLARVSLSSRSPPRARNRSARPYARRPPPPRSRPKTRKVKNFLINFSTAKFFTFSPLRKTLASTIVVPRSSLDVASTVLRFVPLRGLSRDRDKSRNALYTVWHEGYSRYLFALVPDREIRRRPADRQVERRNESVIGCAIAVALCSLPRNV